MEVLTKIIIRSEIFKEGNQYIAICQELNVSSFGETPEQAKKSLSEAISLFLEECERMNTINEVLEEAGYRKENFRWIAPTPVSVENLQLQI